MRDFYNNDLFYNKGNNRFALSGSDEEDFIGNLMQGQNDPYGPFSGAQQAVAPNAMSPVMGMPGPPTLPMQAPQQAMPQQQMPQQGGGLNAFLNSPGFTMASAALQNLGNSAPNSRGRQVDPVAAMQEAQRKNEVLQQRRAQILDNQRQAAQQREYRALQMQQAQKQLDAPTPIANPYSNMPADIQMWKLSGSELPFTDWQAKNGSSSQPAYVQEFMFGENLRNTDPEAYKRFGNKRSPTTVKFGDATLLVDPQNPSKATVIGPNGYEDIDDVAGWVNKQAAEKKRGEAQSAQSIEQSGKYFEELGKVESGLGNITEAIAAIDAGADTGVIDSFLPSVKSSSIALDNVRKRMGLDVIGLASFGALSKGELDLALDTAIPTNMDSPQLREWLVNKRIAQEKLSNELSRAVIFLNEGGTIADLVKQRGKKDEDLGSKDGY